MTGVQTCALPISFYTPYFPSFPSYSPTNWFKLCANDTVTSIAAISDFVGIIYVLTFEDPDLSHCTSDFDIPQRYGFNADPSDFDVFVASFYVDGLVVYYPKWCSEPNKAYWLLVNSSMTLGESQIFRTASDSSDLDCPSPSSSLSEMRCKTPLRLDLDPQESFTIFPPIPLDYVVGIGRAHV